MDRFKWVVVAVAVGFALGVSGTVGAHAADGGSGSSLGVFGEVLGFVLMLVAVLLLALLIDLARKAVALLAQLLATFRGAGRR